ARAARHVCYCFTPARYLWDQREEYLSRERSSPLARAAARACFPYLRRWDRRSARRVDRFVAISRFVAERIRNYYGRDAEVIHPPVDAARFRTASPAELGDYYLMVTALAPYKGIDVAMDACERLRRRLVVVGRGEDEARLRARAGRYTQFAGWLPDDQVARAYERCRALLVPGVEDFGIAPLEAMAAGRPVIALGAGGVRETVVTPAQSGAATGIFFDDPSADALADAIEAFERDAGSFDPQAARRRALEFDAPVFRARIAALLASEGVREGSTPA
ncbi:MAG: glycosyltransferase, partial [Planctomycetes bacterium]|nr:glycosyltransferase [Planctomycetota bacterium]